MVFCTYLFTLAPGVIQVDAGELAAVQATLGIAHPTGYPLFTLLGYLFLLLPLPFPVIVRTNLLAAVLCGLGVVFFIRTSIFLLMTWPLQPMGKPRGKPMIVKPGKSRFKESLSTSVGTHSRFTPVVAVSGGWMLAFSRTYWFQSMSVEVYSLHIFLLTAAVFILIKAFLADPFPEKAEQRLWMVFAFILGLGLANHMTMLLLCPGAAYLFFVKEGFKARTLKKMGSMVAVFLPTLLLLYAYLPLRASQGPVLNWGDPSNLERFINHVSGRQYQVWLYSSWAAAKRQLLYFLGRLPLETAVIGLVLAFLGLFYGLRRAKRFTVFLLLCFMVTVSYAVNYDIHDIDAYFLLAYIALAFFAVFGLARVVESLGKRKIRAPVMLCLLFLSPAVQFVTNFPKADQSGLHTFDDYTRSLLGSVERGALILSYQWDFFISASYYYQFADGFRRDIAVVDKELLRRSWYYRQLEKNHPDVLQGLRSEIASFIQALRPFERGKGYDAARLERSYRTIMTKLVTENFDERSVYLGPEIVENEMQKGELVLPPEYTVVPHLFLYKVTRKDKYVPAPNPDFRIRLPRNQTEYTQVIARMTATMLFNRAIYERQHDRPERMRLYLQKIVSDFPDYPLPPEWRALIDH